MKLLKLLLVFSFVVFNISAAAAISGFPATEESMNHLKRAIQGGIIHIGQTRLKDISNVYGYPTNVTDDETRLVYDYGDLRIEFTKMKMWKSWDYDSFKKPVYTDDVDDLRFDLESEELVGENITYRKVMKSYGEPTEKKETTEDGQMSIYYYGDIKLVFENYIVVRSWRGQNLEKETSEGVLTGQ